MSALHADHDGMHRSFACASFQESCVRQKVDHKIDNACSLKILYMVRCRDSRRTKGVVEADLLRAVDVLQMPKLQWLLLEEGVDDGEGESEDDGGD